jgi:hypothetical protein
MQGCRVALLLVILSLSIALCVRAEDAPAAPTTGAPTVPVPATDAKSTTGEVGTGEEALLEIPDEVAIRTDADHVVGDFDWQWDEEAKYYYSAKANLWYDPPTKNYYHEGTDKWYDNITKVPGVTNYTDDHPTLVAHLHFGPPEGPPEDWKYEADSGLYWSETAKLYYEPSSTHFFDPEHRVWFDSDTEEWYQHENDVEDADDQYEEVLEGDEEEAEEEEI